MATILSRPQCGNSRSAVISREISSAILNNVVCSVKRIRNMLTGLILGLHPANERRRYKLTPSGCKPRLSRLISKGPLTHWDRVTHICVSKLSTIGSDDGLSPDRHQAIIWTNAGILLIGTLGTNFNEILIEIHTFSFKNIHLNMSSGKWRPFCLGLNVLKPCLINK